MVYKSKNETWTVKQQDKHNDDNERVTTSMV